MKGKDETEDQAASQKTEAENKRKTDYQEDHNKWRRESWKTQRNKKRILPKVNQLLPPPPPLRECPTRRGRADDSAHARVLSQCPLIPFKTCLDFIQLGQGGVFLLLSKFHVGHKESEKKGLLPLLPTPKTRKKIITMLNVFIQVHI